MFRKRRRVTTAAASGGSGGSGGATGERETSGRNLQGGGSGEGLNRGQRGAVTIIIMKEGRSCFRGWRARRRWRSRGDTSKRRASEPGHGRFLLGRTDQIGLILLWVFFSERFFGASVRVSVATQKALNPVYTVATEPALG